MNNRAFERCADEIQDDGEFTVRDARRVTVPRAGFIHRTSKLEPGALMQLRVPTADM